MKGNQFELNKKSGYWFIKNGPHSPKRLGKSLSGVLEFLSQDAERFDIGLSLLKKDTVTLQDIQTIKERMYSEALENYQLHNPDNGELIEALEIVPGFKKEFSIQSEEPLWIGGSTNVSILYAREFYPGGIAMELDQINGDSGVGSTIGGSTIFKPRGGVITFEARNLVEDSYKAVIYSRSVDPSGQ